MSIFSSQNDPAMPAPHATQAEEQAILDQGEQDTTAPLLPTGMWRTLAMDLRAPKMHKGLDKAWSILESKVQAWAPRRTKFMWRARRVQKLQSRFESCTEEQLREHAEDLRALFRRNRDKRADIEAAMALIGEVVYRRMGFRLHLVQFAAALVMESGAVAELATGEGKTVSAVMPAVIGGWRGQGCHVITVNDYLAQRDAEWMQPIYGNLGVTVSFITGESQPHERRQAYMADVTYTTNKEVTADFLRDRLVLGRVRRLPSVLLHRMADRDKPAGADRMVMRGLACAIVDEADSVLIDEAVTPLIISGESPNAEQVESFCEAAAAARELEPGRDFRIDRKWREVRLTRHGEERTEQLTARHGGIWHGRRRREELVTQALSARELFLKGQHYVIQEGKVVIVDEFTGRLMPDRTWRDGLHQAVEAKEGLEVQPPKQTLARVSFQRFFRTYRKLSGMTGTMWENNAELWQTYRIPVVRIPTHKPCIRRQPTDRVFTNADRRWEAVVKEVQRIHAEGRPLLIGTRSVESSEHLSTLLEREGLAHQVLNAVRHAEEAEIVAQAGQPGHITIATNMAGRGTDIKLGEGVREQGGLAVIATERHESGRIDRQLFGRAGRQGDPGSAIAIISIDDELFMRYAPAWMRSLARSTPTLAHSVRRIAQGRSERMARRQRAQVLVTDDWLDENLSFARPE
ncbi:MAG: hypothetical protein GC159_22845 [Phycisphaera sp.]|nr:hypothetical protein [Phycisphaera sp.]